MPSHGCTQTVRNYGSQWTRRENQYRYFIQLPSLSPSRQNNIHQYDTTYASQLRTIPDLKRKLVRLTFPSVHWYVCDFPTSFANLNDDLSLTIEWSIHTKIAFNKGLRNYSYLKATLLLFTRLQQNIIPTTNWSLEPFQGTTTPRHTTFWTISLTKLQDLSRCYGQTVPVEKEL